MYPVATIFRMTTAKSQNMDQARHISVDDPDTLKQEDSKLKADSKKLKESADVRHNGGKCVMYADYIEHQGGDENSIISAEHIDVLTFNRIDFEKLSEMQKRIIGRVHSRLTAFEEENADMISSYLKSYSINGTSMEFGASWNLMCISGVAIPADLYALLKSTGLCYPAI